MTSMLRRAGTFVTAAALALSADVASAQSAGAPPAHDRQGAAAPRDQGAEAGMPDAPHDVTARIAVLDARIQGLVTDMHLFVGEVKIDTMAALLTAIVERQSLVGREMRRMHRQMTHRAAERREPAALLSEREFAAADEEPGSMCAPLR